MIAHAWQIIPGALWQADMYGATTTNANVAISCTVLSALPSTVQKWFLQRPMHLLCPFRECDELPDLNIIDLVVALAADALAVNRTVVVNCDTGKNRSGLIVGLVLVEMGYANVVEYIQKVIPGAMTNKTFADYVHGMELVDRPKDAATEIERRSRSLED